MITIIKNVLTTKERKQLIKDSKPLLFTGEELEERFHHKFPPSKQTLSLLHTNDKFKSLIVKMLDRINDEIGLSFGTDNVWVNWNSGKKNEMAWHSHPSPYTCVYYMKTVLFLNSGTQFKHKFVRAPQNSLMLFPGDIDHTVPSYPFHFIERYTLAMDLNINRCME